VKSTTEDEKYNTIIIIMTLITVLPISLIYVIGPLTVIYIYPVIISLITRENQLIGDSIDYQELKVTQLVKKRENFFQRN